MKKYHFVAIGGGEAGLTATANVKSSGLNVALVDRGPIGGLCSLRGCNPKKVLVRSSEVLEEIRSAGTFGIEVGDVHVNWSRVIDRKESFTRPVTAGAEASLRAMGIDLIKGAARFTSSNELEVDGERIQAEGILIATGSIPRPLEFEGAELVKTSDDILVTRTVPNHLFIIGAGVVAFEFGHVFARLGSKVTMATPSQCAIPVHDLDMVNTLIEFSQKLGIKVLTNSRVRSVRQQSERYQVEYESDGRTETTDAGLILNAAGRIPSIDDLALKRGQVERNKNGVAVDEYLRSVSNKHVFAAGDAHGRMQLSPIASYEGHIAARNFLEGNVERVDYDAVPRILFIVPPLASVGVTEAEARKRGLDVKVVNNDMADWKVFAIAGAPVARAKVLLDSSSGRILGAHIFGPGAAEYIHIFAMAIRFGILADDLKTMVYGYPTFASALAYTMG